MRVNEAGQLDIDGLTEPQHRWLHAFMAHGTVRAADQSTGIDRTTTWRWRAQDETFKAAFNEIRSTLVEALEDEAVARALAGKDDPYSGAILLALLRVHGSNPNWRPNTEAPATTIHQKILILGTDPATGHAIRPPV